MLEQLLRRLAQNPGLGGGIQDMMGQGEGGYSDPYMIEQLRKKKQFAQNQSMQNFLAPAEHQQFMKDTMQANPMQGLAATMGIPAYTGAKMMGYAPGGTGDAKTSQGSIDEILRALLGARQGMSPNRGMPQQGGQLKQMAPETTRTFY